MYYLLYGLLYLISLLPFFILYAISDFAYFIIYHIAGYRKAIVFSNLDIAFPEKTVVEKKEIARQFYKGFVDTFVEMIKLISISEKELMKRAEINMHECKTLIEKGLNIQFESGHQMNWELGNHIFSKNLQIPFVGVYMRIKNKAVDRLFYEQRKKFGTILIEASDFKMKIHQYFKNQYSIGLIADQNPGGPPYSYWLNFFGKPAPFVTGPDKGARRNNCAVVFVNLVRVKRGYYRYELTVITENAASFKDGQLTLLYRDFLEASIRKQPNNYLWSHRRWKWEYKPEYEKRWIDKVPAPQ